MAARRQAGVRNLGPALDLLKSELHFNKMLRRVGGASVLVNV